MGSQITRKAGSQEKKSGHKKKSRVTRKQIDGAPVSCELNVQSVCKVRMTIPQRFAKHNGFAVNTAATKSMIGRETNPCKKIVLIFQTDCTIRPIFNKTSYDNFRVFSSEAIGNCLCNKKACNLKSGIVK